jgi:molybdopterin synthase sulfur carrier subunit
VKRIYINSKSEIVQKLRGSALKVKVEFLGHIKNMISSEREEEVEISEGASIADLLMILSEKYGEPFKRAVYEKSGTDVKSNYIITVNGYLLNQLKGLETKLKNNDHVTLLPIVSGG